jgi:HAD superfamily hydrolase (TIGR01509 family)
MIRAVLFDFDGTLTRPGVIDFAGMRSALGCAEGQPILEHVEQIANPAERERADAILDAHEMAAAERSEPNDDAEETVHGLLEMGFPVSVLTRNCRRAIDRSLENFASLSVSRFTVLLTRDDVSRPKPDPEGALRAAREMNVPVESLLCVGDYVYDVELARNAGCTSVYLSPSGDEPTIKPDYTIKRLGEVIRIVTAENRTD